VAVALSLTSCSLGSADPAGGSADKAGGSGAVVTVRLATPDSPGQPAGRDAEHFAERVRSLSQGRLRVAVTHDVGKDERSWDQKAARLVIDGDHDLGLIPARAWDAVGVSSLRALQAPFLLSSDAALDAVVSDPVASDLLNGLAKVGVVGLALVPEGLRHPVGFGAPLREPADFKGHLIRAPRSDLTWKAMRALGAKPVDLNGPEFQAGIDDGSVRGAESSAALVGMLPRPGILTANLTPYAKLNVLVANAAAVKKLSAEHRDILQRAAQQSRDHSVRTRQSDAEALATACSSGVEVVLATSEQQAAMTAATKPLLDELRADREAGPLLRRVAAIVEAAGPERPSTGCPSASGGTPSGAPELAGLEGTWRYEVTHQQGLDAGLPDEVAAADMGVQTVRMRDGRYEWSWRSRLGIAECTGTYSAENGLVVFADVRGPRCAGYWEARPRVSADQISWTDVRTRVVGDPIDQTVRGLLHSTPWRRVDGPAPAAFPEGVYRWRVTPTQLTAAGVSHGDAYNNSGLMTMTVRDGRWLHQTVSEADPPDCGGTYQVDGDRMEFTADAGPKCGSVAGGLLFSGTWKAVGNDVRFSDITPANAFNEVLWGSGWRRIS
jgi:TRAP-type C4-dicarboxylate transport system substrate-binding protein